MTGGERPRTLCPAHSVRPSSRSAVRGGRQRRATGRGPGRSRPTRVGAMRSGPTGPAGDGPRAVRRKDELKSLSALTPLSAFTAEAVRGRAATDQNRFTTEDTEITEKNPLILPGLTILHTEQETECQSYRARRDDQEWTRSTERAENRSSRRIGPNIMMSQRFCLLGALCTTRIENLVRLTGFHNRPRSTGLQRRKVSKNSSLCPLW